MTNIDSPNLNLTDSVQVGHNTIGPSTGDIVINSGNSIERCSMCKTPIDANSNPGLYCFKEGCDALFCKNCESFFRSSRGPGEKPYCSEHVSEFVGAPVPEAPPGLHPTQPVSAQALNPMQVTTQPTQMVVGYTNQVTAQQRQAVQQFGGVVQPAAKHMNASGHNPYINQKLIDPITALRRTLKSWNGEGRCQRSEFWWGALLYYIPLTTFLGVTYVWVSVLSYDSMAASYPLAILVLLMVYFVLLIPLLSQQIRRLHDIGYSGWWVLVGFLLPYIGGFILLILSVLPSQPHPNKYG
jgi:uncharacterized membrane protein YhaH (DUF805 family)